MGEETNAQGRDSVARMRFIVKRGFPHFVGAREAAQIVRLIDAWSEPDAISEVASREPAIAQGIVRLANSPLYGNAQLRTLESAIEFLGFEELRRTMTMLAIASWTPDARETAMFDVHTFRRRAISLAHLSEATARHLRLEHASKYFFAGLFADVGYLFLAMQTPFSVRHIVSTHRRTQGLTLQDAEFYSVGFTHAELSAVAAEEFAFEREVVEAVRWHTEPDHCPEEHQTVADVVNAASGVLDVAGLPAAHGLPPAVASPSALGRLRLRIEAVEAQIEGVCERTDTVLGAINADQAA